THRGCAMGEAIAAGLGSGSRPGSPVGFLRPFWRRPPAFIVPYPLEVLLMVRNRRAIRPKYVTQYTAGEAPITSINPSRISRRNTRAETSYGGPPPGWLNRRSESGPPPHNSIAANASRIATVSSGTRRFLEGGNSPSCVMARPPCAKPIAAHVRRSISFRLVTRNHGAQRNQRRNHRRNHPPLKSSHNTITSALRGIARLIRPISTINSQSNIFQHSKKIPKINQRRGAPGPGSLSICHFPSRSAPAAIAAREPLTTQ